MIFPYIICIFQCSSVLDYGWFYPTYFLIFAVIQFIFIIIFLVCQKKYRLTNVNSQQMEMNQFLKLSFTRWSD